MKSPFNQFSFYLYSKTYRKWVAADLETTIRNNNAHLHDLMNNLSGKLLKEYVEPKLPKTNPSPILPLAELSIPSPILFITPPNLSPIKRAEVMQHLYFYTNHPVIFINNYEILPIDVNYPVLITDEYNQLNPPPRNFNQGTYDVDHQSNPFAGWVWHYLINTLDSTNTAKDIIQAKKVFLNYLHQLKKNKRLQKTYLFGTGPSLAKVQTMDFSDGYRIVCNTVVKDKKTWHHIKPHFVVAADAIFHFGTSAYADAFRQDLKNRLSESKSVLFVYPSLFHTYVKNEFSGFNKQLIPIPTRENLHTINTNLEKHYYLPSLANILTYIMLPLAVSLTKSIYLWGFDGRKSTDTLFWTHSNKHNYPDLMNTVIQANPAFFNFHVPKKDPNKYFNTNLGPNFENILQKLESQGYHFYMMHASTIDAMHRREIPYEKS